MLTKTNFFGFIFEQPNAGFEDSENLPPETVTQKNDVKPKKRKLKETINEKV